jgi:hypothetical protein
LLTPLPQPLPRKQREGGQDHPCHGNAIHGSDQPRHLGWSPLHPLPTF